MAEQVLASRRPCHMAIIIETVRDNLGRATPCPCCPRFKGHVECSFRRISPRQADAVDAAPVRCRRVGSRSRSAHSRSSTWQQAPGESMG
jgi:hypothetical protein